MPCLQQLNAVEIPVFIELSRCDYEAIVKWFAIDRDAVIIICGDDITFILRILRKFHIYLFFYRVSVGANLFTPT